MILYLNKLIEDNFVKVGVIDNASSVIWVKRFNAVGQFEIYIKASTELYDLLDGDIFITRDDSNVAMYVENIKLNTDEENGDYLTISGRSAEVILAWRIVQRVVFSAASTTAESIIRTLIRAQLIYNEIIINPNAITWLTLGEDHQWQDLITRQYTGKVLLDVVQELCVSYDYGFEFAWNGNGFTINLYKGTDRSYDQIDRPFVVFSPEFENLGNTEYIKDTSNYANAAIIGGEGEGSERKYAFVYPEGVEGFYRRVIYIDARNSSSDNGQLTNKEYTTMLQNQGKEALEQRKITTSFNGEILNYNNYTYGVDYNLGDKVTVINEYGIKGNATITEITEVEDESGYRLVPTLSEWSVIEYEEEDD